MSLPQYPNVFYGAVFTRGEPAPTGMIVTAVVDYNLPTERHFSLGVGPRGKFGAANGPKLKVGGSGEPIDHLARIAFFVTNGDYAPLRVEAGHAHFYADNAPHVTRLVLCQD